MLQPSQRHAQCVEVSGNSMWHNGSHLHGRGGRSASTFRSPRLPFHLYLCCLRGAQVEQRRRARQSQGVSVPAGAISPGQLVVRGALVGKGSIDVSSHCNGNRLPASSGCFGDAGLPDLPDHRGAVLAMEGSSPQCAGRLHRSLHHTAGGIKRSSGRCCRRHHAAVCEYFQQLCHGAAWILDVIAVDYDGRRPLLSDCLGWAAGVVYVQLADIAVVGSGVQQLAYHSFATGADGWVGTPTNLEFFSDL
mmetsp:Transcript_26460/g.61977  ORF Transcript_26460/g.61977 Transcript_26460/m.61977 type:complete len:248 (+) Transcript_26460:260-1003(+)